jgi:hypothetical protein
LWKEVCSEVEFVVPRLGNGGEVIDALASGGTSGKAAGIVCLAEGGVEEA